MPSFDDLPVAVTIAEQAMARGRPTSGGDVDEPEPAGPSADRATPPESVTPAPDEGEAFVEASAEPEPELRVVEVPPEPQVAAPPPEPQVAAAPTLEPQVAAQPPQPQAPPPDEDLWVEPQREPEPRVKRASSPVRPGELPERRVVVIDEDPDIDIVAGQEAPPPPPDDDDEHPGMAEIGATLGEDSGRRRRWRMFRRGGDR
jgi:hypothetical protein